MRRISARPSVSFALSLAAVLCLLQTVAWAANAVHYPKPAPARYTQDGTTITMLDDQYIHPDQYSTTYLPGSSYASYATLYFTDLAVADGGNAAGTNYHVCIRELALPNGSTTYYSAGDQIPASLTTYNMDNVTNDEVQVVTDQSDSAEQLSCQPGAPDPTGIGNPAMPAGHTWVQQVSILPYRRYAWQVFDDADNALSPVWVVTCPAGQPAKASQNVGVYTTIRWDHDPSHFGVEKLVFRSGNLTAGSTGWYDPDVPDHANEPNPAYIVATYDPASPTDRVYTPARLSPGATYTWRVAHTTDAKVTYYSDVQTFTCISAYSNTISGVNSAVIYWQHPDGTKAITPAEDTPTFQEVAAKIQTIHQTWHYPAVTTMIVGTQQILADYDDTELVAAVSIDNGSRAASDLRLSRAIRTMLKDTITSSDPSPTLGHFYLPNLRSVVILGDAAHVPASSLWRENTLSSWKSTDLFYSSQGIGAETAVPKFAVSRMPLRQTYFLTVDTADGQTWDIDTPKDNDDDWGTYETDISGNTSIDSYVPYAIDANGLLPAREARHWRMPFVDKLYHYAYNLNSEEKKEDAYTGWFGRVAYVSAQSGRRSWYQYAASVSQYNFNQTLSGGEDVFSGLRVRKYSVYNGAADEKLTHGNVVRHLVTTTAYQQKTILELDTCHTPGLVYYEGTGASDEFTLYSGSTAASVIEDTDFDDAQTFDANFEDPANRDAGRRPLLIATAPGAAKWDGATASIGDAMVMAQTGPIGMAGFVGSYWESGSVSINSSQTNPDPVDNPIGTLQQNSVGAQAEFLKLFAQEFAESNGGTIGEIFNAALAQYVSDHATELGSGTDLVEDVVYGATLLGDAALVMPHRDPAVKDDQAPTLGDANPRAATVVTGYGATTRYNSQNMPIHTILSTGSNTSVTIRITTNAPTVRVRVLTPFLQMPNADGAPGAWFSTTEVTRNAESSSGTDPTVWSTSGATLTYTFAAQTPSVYLVLVESLNPSYTTSKDTHGVTDGDVWRWLKGTAMYIQVVNQFVRSADAATNILVVDLDQHDRFHLDGQYGGENEGWYVNPIIDDKGYDATDPRTLTSNPYHKPALSVLNKDLSDKYKYQYWCCEPYRNDASSEGGSDYLTQKRYYGELTPAVIKSFAESNGCIVLFTGDGSLGADTNWFTWNILESNDETFLQTFVNQGGRLFVSSPQLALQGGTLLNYLGATNKYDDTDYTNINGNFAGTLSETINQMTIDGGDGASNADLTPYVATNGVSARTVFTWNTNAGAGTPETGTLPCGIDNRVAATGNRTTHTAYFAFPVEAINQLGDLVNNKAGRENTMRQVIDWLRSVPKATLVSPNDGAWGVATDATLQWNPVGEAQYYKLYLGSDRDLLDSTTAPETLVKGASINYLNPTYSLTNITVVKGTTYFWRVDCGNADDDTRGDVWSFTIVADPLDSLNPDPENLEIQVPVDKVFTWTNPGTVDTYDVYMWTDADGDQTFIPPDTPQYHVGSGLTTTQYPASGTPTLTPDTQYYWRVDATNQTGTDAGTVWAFHTITVPAAPTTPQPADNDTGVLTNVTLSWTQPSTPADAEAASWDVFIYKDGEAGPTTGQTPAAFNTAGGHNWSGNTTAASWTPPQLDVSQKFHWQVWPKNAAGTQETVSEWTFTTAATVSIPDAPATPSPATGTAGVSAVPITVSWQGGGAATWDIWVWDYSGTTPLTTDTPTAAGLTSTTYDIPATDPSGLDRYDLANPGTRIKWMVVGKNSNGDAGPASAVWNLRYGAEQITAAKKVAPTNLETNVSTTPTFSWTGAAGAVDYYLYIWNITDGETEPALGATPTYTVPALADPALQVDFTVTTALLANKQYGWRVDSHVNPTTLGISTTFSTGATVTPAPGAVTKTSPTDGATGQATSLTLTWSASTNTTSYNVYYSTNLLSRGTATSTAATSLAISGLTAGDTYYWWVDSLGPGGTTADAAPFSFGVAAATTTTTTTTSTASTAGAGGGGGGGGGGCFIATSAYELAVPLADAVSERNCTGLYRLAPEQERRLNEIRGLRDEVLLHVGAGRSFSAWYYAVGPYAADAIRHHEQAKAAVRRVLLNPLAKLSQACAQEEEGK